jgi:AcrR family transcriptional regulator
MPRKKAAHLPRKRPTQARSAATVEVILEAASHILATRALAGYNTTSVAEQAGVSIGSIYQYFPHRDALTAELILRVHRSMVSKLEEALLATEGMTLEQALPTIVQVGIPADHKLARLLEVEEERLPRSAELISLERDIDSLTTRFIKRFANGLVSPKALEIAASDVVSIVRGMTDAALSRGTVTADLIQRISRALLGYLKPLLAGEVGNQIPGSAHPRQKRGM